MALKRDVLAGGVVNQALGEKGSESMAMKRVLVVDDEAHITHVVSLKLRNAGYEVLTASDGEEGY